MKQSRAGALGFTVIELLMFVLIVTVPLAMWAAETSIRKETAEILKSVPAAEGAYWRRSSRDFHVMRLSAEASESRAPGHYQKIVDLWLDASKVPEAQHNSKIKLAWVFELESAEQAAVSTLLQEMKINRDELVQLSLKLEAISPQLTKAETSTLERIADLSTARKLDDLRVETIRKLRQKLIGMGASEGGLNLNHIKEPRS